MNHMLLSTTNKNLDQSLSAKLTQNDTGPNLRPNTTLLLFSNFKMLSKGHQGTPKDLKEHHTDYPFTLTTIYKTASGQPP
ncbi:hypothetical protein E2C01_040874 [Portunus trituberculatus]|uniref:Uncharacterized protein n=1 Tax=Portunus trituberculatus TaxID=210409 RepID=A0A5B7FHS3_PORTR|nr:hypothetical protein [Portunus trituberculatus]